MKAWGKVMKGVQVAQSGRASQVTTLLEDMTVEDQEVWRRRRLKAGHKVVRENLVG